MSQTYLAVDLGGTKIAAGLVDENGNVLKKETRQWSQDRGPQGLIDQLVNIIQPFAAAQNLAPIAGIASAGPVEPVNGVLLNPTNMVTDGKHWGVVEIVKPLQQRLNLKFKMENDAACAVLAEHWVGEAKGKENCLALTLGTGIGVGVICNGQLVRCGRNLHPEAGHIYLNADDENTQSGNGDFGTVEAYLSGKNFSRRVGKILGRQGLTGKEIVALAENGEQVVLGEFEKYSLNLARAIKNYVYLFAPEVIVLSGGFSIAWPHFLPATKTHMEVLLAPVRIGIDLFPEIKISRFQEDMGLIGAAYVAKQQI